MVVYIYQCYCLNSFYPLFPLLYPQVCCLHLRLYKQGYQSVYKGLGSQWDRLWCTVHPGRCHDHGGPCEWYPGPHAIHSGKRIWCLWAHEKSPCAPTLLQEVTPKYHRQDFKQASQTFVSTRPRVIIFIGPHASQKRAHVCSHNQTKIRRNQAVCYFFGETVPHVFENEILEPVWMGSNPISLLPSCVNHGQAISPLYASVSSSVKGR